MNGLYTETYVKRKMTAGIKLGRALLVVLGFGLLLLGMFSGAGIVSFLGVAVLIALYFLLPMFKVDWEYIFCDGQIDFDRISGGEKRKTMLRIDMDNVEIMAPERSHELDSYNHQQNLTVKDFSSKEPDAKRFVMFTAKDGQKLKIIFEPSETMVDYARQKAPRKVFKD